MRRVFLYTAASVALLYASWYLGRLPADSAAAGNAAYERGDYADALRHYARCPLRGPQAFPVVRNQAAALYRLEKFQDADPRYRVAGQRDNALRAAEAAYDRGNCALRLACQEPERIDPDLLSQAVEQYRACLDHHGTPAALAADARHNLELAKLLAAGQGCCPDCGRKGQEGATASADRKQDPGAGPSPVAKADSGPPQSQPRPSCPT